ncbi:hypothetical protein [Xanthomonas albilineans]|uniref:hypothetical protein n=1 Tax=Xanthomonas albilineans TaxID=29447 RepID=UPI001269A312|nr:hypothetical protein [Xanthomonas albilineans]
MSGLRGRVCWCVCYWSFSVLARRRGYVNAARFKPNSLGKSQGGSLFYFELDMDERHEEIHWSVQNALLASNGRSLNVFSGLTINRGGVAYLIFGGVIGLGAFLMLAGLMISFLMISFFKGMRQRAV